MGHENTRERQAEENRKRQVEKKAQMLNAKMEPLILILAVPAIISQLVTSFYNLADTYFVSALGISETGAIGIAYPVMTVIHALGMLMGKGTGVSLSQALGKGDTEDAENITAAAVVYMFLIGIFFAVLCRLFLKPLAIILGATDTMLPFVCIYLRYIIYALPFKAVSYTLGCVFRFQGQFIRSLIGLASGAIINVILDPIMIFNMGMGVKGAALATAIGQSCSFIIMVWMCGRGGCIALDIRKFHFDLKQLRQYLKIGTPSLVKNSLSSVAVALLNMAASGVGDAAVASMTIVSRCINVCNTAFFGLTESLQTFVSFNYGAKQYGRMRKAYYFCMRFGMVTLTVLAVLMFVGARYLISAFHKDPTVIALGIGLLRAQCCTLPLLPITSAGFVFLQAISENRRSALVGVGRQALFLIPIVLILPHFFGFAGVLLAQPLSDICATVLGAFVLKPVLLRFQNMDRAEPVMDS